LDCVTTAFSDQFDTVLDLGCQLSVITQTPVTVSIIKKKKKNYHTIILGTDTSKKVISRMFGLEV